MGKIKENVSAFILFEEMKGITVICSSRKGTTAIGGTEFLNM